MRIRFFLFMTAACSVGTFAGVQACGGSSSDNNTTTGDAAPEATMGKDASVADTFAPDVFDARPPCDPNKDILKDIPDAQIPDSSATTGECIGCVQAMCMQEVTDCKKDCSRSTSDLGCQDLAAKALSCYAAKHDFLMCAGDFAGAKNPTQGIGIALGSCVAQNCQDQCGVPEGGM